MQSFYATENGNVDAPNSYFNMWHDYMNLGTKMEQLLRQREMAADQRNNPQEFLLAVEPLSPRQTQPFDTQSMDSASTRTRSSESLSFANLNKTRSASRGSCGFCKQNGETPEVYLSHKLKARDGKVICPILRSYVCPTCEATGDTAHTRLYCPRRNELRASVW